jgi:hypothetical protein
MKAEVIESGFIDTSGWLKCGFKLRLKKQHSALVKVVDILAQCCFKLFIRVSSVATVNIAS